MSKYHLKNGIQNRSQKKVRISDELAEVLDFLCRNGLTESQDKSAKTAQITSACPEATYQRLERLHDLGFVNKERKGPKTYVIHTRKDEVVNGQALLPLVEEELRRLKDHIRVNSTINLIVANELGISPSEVISDLEKGGFNEKQAKLERAVEAIEADPSVSKGQYGSIIFRHASNWYQASRRTEQLYGQ